MATMLKVYLTFLKIGLLGFGGGYMMIPLFFLEVVQRHHWLTHEQMFNLVAMAQTIPGIFATNAAFLVGMSMGRCGVALAATLGTLSPAFVILMLKEKLLEPHLGKAGVQAVLRGIGLVVIGIIAGTAITMGKKAVFDLYTLGVFCLTLYLFLFREWDVAKAVLTTSVVGVAVIWLLSQAGILISM